MIRNFLTKPGIVINSLYLVCVVFFAIAIAHNHVKIISHPIPLDYNEASMLVTTSTIARGENPYSLENQPSRMSLYPVLLNIVVAPLSLAFGNTLELHRAVTGLFILGCVILCFYLCRRESGTRIDSFTAAVLVYAGLLFYSTPIASPNGIGLFLFLSAITVPWLYGFSTRSLAVTIVLGILAFYAKQYFIACIGYVALYLFLAESKKRALYFGLVTLTSFIVVLVLVCYTSPYYLEDTFFAVQSSAKIALSDDFVMTQFREFFKIYLPLLIILPIAIIHKYSSIRRVNIADGQRSQPSKLINLTNFDTPLLLRKPNYIWVCFTCSVIIIVLVLGKNRGNHLTYLFQLISPFLLIGTFALISDMPKWRWAFAIPIAIALYNSYSMLPKDFSFREENWQIIRKEIAEADDLYASPLLLQDIVKKGAPIYDNGPTRYFVFGKDVPSFLIKDEQVNTVPAVWDRYVELIQTKIRTQEFDVLLLDDWMRFPTLTKDITVDPKNLFSTDKSDTQALLKKYYYQTAKITLPLSNRLGGGNFGVHIWKRIPATIDVDKQQSPK